MTKTKRPITHFIDENGQACVSVPLSNYRGHAILYLEDYGRILDYGLSPNWQLNQNGQGQWYVKAKLWTGERIVVARAIAGAPFLHQVRYRNHNSLDLRADNLLVVEGGKAHVDCSALHAVRCVFAEEEDGE